MPVIYYHFYSHEGKTTNEIRTYEHEAGRALLRRGLTEQYQIEIPNASTDDLIATSRYGKPHFKDFPSIHFSITHCHGLVACALDAKPIGLDAEHPRVPSPAIIKKTFSPEEKCFFEQYAHMPEEQNHLFLRFWTLKEAYVKLTGKGLRTPLNDVSFTLPEGDNGRILCFDPTVSCFQHCFESGHTLSLCHLSDSEPVLLIEE